jgi:hypothetical protein
MRPIIKLYNKFADNYYTRVLLKSINPIDINNSEYIFIFNQATSKFNGKLYILVSHELSKRGIASCFQYKNDLWEPYSPRFYLDGYEISNSFILEKKYRIKPLPGPQLFFKWSIDIENNIIEAEGINFFPYINNTLRKIQKRYNVFLYDPDNRPVYDDLIQTCDLLLKHFLLLKEYLQKNQKKIRLVGFESEYVPNGILKMLCDQLSHNRDIEYIEMRRGYKSYFGQHHPNDSYISYSNLATSRTETCLAISKKEWARKDHKIPEVRELLKPISNALEKAIYHKIPTTQKNVIKTIENYKSKDNKIFVLVSHVFYDTPVNDESKGFNGMCEWITETIKYFYGKENLLLLKPHPHEFLPDQPQKTPNETLASFLRDTELPENIILLDPHQFSIKDLSPYISCGLIWRSSVAMELTFLEIPCIIAGNPIYRVLDLYYAKDKEHFFNLIEQSHKIKVTDKQKEDVATYLYLLDKKHIHIECISYDGVRKFHWNIRALRKYLKYGDKSIKSIAGNVLA